MSRHAHDEHFEEFPPHTRFKHLCLQFYLETWVHKVGLGRAADDQLVMVDAFAGEGADEVGNHGSPLRMARIAAMNEDRLTMRRGTPVSLQVVLMERRPGRRRRLEARVTPFGDQVRVLRGTLDQEIDGLLELYRGAPMLFFLDPYGVKGLDADVARRALDAPAREIFMLVDDDGAHRLLSAATKLESRRVSQNRVQASVLDLFEDNESRRKALEMEAVRSQTHLKRTGAGSAKHLTRALGNDNWRALATLRDPAAVRDRFVAMFEEIMHEAGATYTTRIPVRSEGGAPKYVLLHASRARHGRSTMKCEVQRALKQCDLPEGVVAQMRQDMEGDMMLALAQIRNVYAGREVLWREGAPASLREYALQETGLFPWQLDELETRLNAVGCRLPGKTKQYRFPRDVLHAS